MGLKISSSFRHYCYLLEFSLLYKELCVRSTGRKGRFLYKSLWNIIACLFQRTIHPITSRKRPVNEINRECCVVVPRKNPLANCGTRLYCLVSPWPLKQHSLESMKRPPYSLLLALRNARCTGRMSERGNCFPFLRKVNGPLEITLQFRRLMEATMPGVADNDVRTAVEYPRDFTGTVTRKGDLISYAIDLSARRRNSDVGFLGAVPTRLRSHTRPLPVVSRNYSRSGGRQEKSVKRRNTELLEPRNSDFFFEIKVVSKKIKKRKKFFDNMKLIYFSKK